MQFEQNPHLEIEEQQSKAQNPGFENNHQAASADVVQSNDGSGQDKHLAREVTGDALQFEQNPHLGIEQQSKAQQNLGFENNHQAASDQGKQQTAAFASANTHESRIPEVETIGECPSS